MDARRPTPRQLDALCAIIRHIDVHGVCPTHDELGDALGVTRAGAQYHVDQLRACGAVADTRDKWRACEPTARGITLADHWRSVCIRVGGDSEDAA